MNLKFILTIEVKYMVGIYKNFYSTESFVNSIKDQVFLPKYVRKENLTKVYDNTKIPELYVTCWNEGQLVGCLKQICIPTYEYRSYFKNDLNSFYRTIMYVSVADGFKHQGIGTRLFELYFNTYKENDLTDDVILSPFSIEGYKYLRSKILSIAALSNVSVKDSYCFE